MAGVTEVFTEEEEADEIAAEACTPVTAAGHAHLGWHEPDAEK